MSVNLYFKNEIRNDASNFKSVPYGDGTGEKITYKGMNLSLDKGRLYAYWSEDVPIPENIKNDVVEVSCNETIPQMAHRESGIYRENSATCELIPGDHGNAKREKPVYFLKMSAKNLEDIQVLRHKIKTGSIRPEESYECTQGGKSRSQLEDELAQAQMEIIQHKQLLNETLDSMDLKIESARSFIERLEKELFPFCTKVRVINQIRRIFRLYTF